jgi:archaellum component FlaD/FlaE
MGSNMPGSVVIGYEDAKIEEKVDVVEEKVEEKVEVVEEKVDVVEEKVEEKVDVVEEKVEEKVEVVEEKVEEDEEDQCPAELGAWSLASMTGRNKDVDLKMDDTPSVIDIGGKRRKQKPLKETSASKRVRK